MSETAKNFYLSILGALAPQDFQFLCSLYLQDQGYICQLGRMPGSDFSHDLYGSHQGHRFIGHCTTQKKGVLSKLRLDVMNGIDEAKRHGIIYPEIVCFSLGRMFASPAKESNFIEGQLKPAILGIESRYTESPPDIRLITGDQLALEIASSPSSSRAKLFLQRKLRSELDLDTFTAIAAPKRDTVDEDIGLFASLNRYSLAMPAEIRLPILLSAVSAASRLLFDPRIAQQMLSNLPAESNLRSFLMPICKISLAQPLTEQELLDFFTVIIHPAFRELDDLTSDHYTAASRLIRTLVYQRELSLDRPTVVAAIRQLADTNQRYWQIFLCDLYLRFYCGYISVGPGFRELLIEVLGSYLSRNPEKPLSLLWPLIQDPLRISSEDIKSVVIQLSKIAKSCDSTIEGRWCISAALRILPLFSQDDEDEVESSEYLIDVIRSIPSDVTARSPQLAFKHLSILLHAFLRRKNSDFLGEFQQHFMLYRPLLLRPQVLELQLEHAACLYAFCQFYSFAELMQTELGFIISSNQDLFSHPLFFNNAWSSRLQAGRLESKKDIFRALLRYLKLGFTIYVKPLLGSQHLRLLDIPALRRVYPLRPAIAQAITTSLKAFLLKEIQVAPAFFARSTAVFKSINRKENEVLVTKYLEEGFRGTAYDLIRNARHILYTLYSLYYYSTPETAAIAGQLCAKMKSQLKVISYVPGPHWIYIAGINFAQSIVEMRFAAEFGMACIRLERRILRLTTRSSQDTTITFSDEILHLLAHHRNEGSLLARTISDNIQEPEVWNVLATTVYNHKPERRSSALAIASFFYAIAKSFARARRRDDQKYCYNYIKCRSLDLLEERNISLPFLMDTTFYLTSPSAELFAYKLECLEPFMELLGMAWSRLDSDTRERIRNSFNKVEWLRSRFIEVASGGAERPLRAAST